MTVDFKKSAHSRRGTANPEAPINFENDKQKISEKYLFPEIENRRADAVDYERARLALKYRCKILKDQYNKLRDSYKEIYLWLKETVDSESLKPLKLIEPRMLLDPSIFADFWHLSTDESDMISENEDSLSAYSEIQSKYKMNRSRPTKSHTREIAMASTPGIDNYMESEPDILIPKNTIVVSGATRRKKMNIKYATKNIEKAYMDMSNSIDSLWLKYLSLFNLNSNKVLIFLMQKHIVHFKRLIKKKKITRSIRWLTDVVRAGNFKFEADKAEKQRKKLIEFLNIESARGLCHSQEFYSEKNQPIIIEEIWEPDVNLDGLFDEPSISGSSSRSDYSEEENKAHPYKWVFLCHGYNGQPSDMKYMFNQILEKDPYTKIHSWEEFSLNRNKSIIELGELVGNEIIRHVISMMQLHNINKIILIGYSMGGLILRSALPHLKRYKHILDSFITLATPHIGYLTTQSKLLTMGMWVADRFNINNSIAEIMLSDMKNIKDCALYKISKFKGLDWFNNGKKYVLKSTILLPVHGNSTSQMCPRSNLRLFAWFPNYSNLKLISFLADIKIYIDTEWVEMWMYLYSSQL